MKYKYFITFLIFTLLLSQSPSVNSLGSLFSRTVQSIGVKGVFLCDKKPIEKVEIELYEKDTFTYNDLLNRASTDLQGRILLYGSEKETTAIRPYIEISHFCKIKGRNPIKIEYTIPQIYINKGEVPRRYCDLGTIDLSTNFTIACNETEVFLEGINNNKTNTHD
uniref:Transthyretin-like family-containing protein n=1 Tax=Parastrongyloides trichosuri TaxID=131310 RepID=A0A0N4ZIE1_PARTI